MKTITWLAILVLVTGILLTGCAAKPVALTFNELVSAPEKYSGKPVTLEGIYVRSWEGISFSDAVAYIGTGKDRELRPVGDAMWFAGLMPKDVQENLYQYRSPSGDTTYFGKLKVTGKFETEGKYGNMNQYKYRITTTSIELLDWTPPE